MATTRDPRGVLARPACTQRLRVVLLGQLHRIHDDEQPAASGAASPGGAQDPKRLFQNASTIPKRNAGAGKARGAASTAAAFLYRGTRNPSLASTWGQSALQRTFS